MSLIKSFKEWLNEQEKRYPKRPDRILDYFWHFNESLDTPVKAFKKERGQFNSTLFYINLGNKEYRIFVEPSREYGELNIHIGFERFNGKQWFMRGITNDLKPKEILSLFSTLKQIITENNPDSVFMLSRDEPEKITRYWGMLQKMNLKEYECVRNDDLTVILYKKGSKVQKDIKPGFWDLVEKSFLYKNTKQFGEK